MPSRAPDGVRTVYLGTSEFAAAVLHRVAASPHRPELVITRPDRPRGRGRHLSAPPVAQAARELGIKLAQPQLVNDEPTRRCVAEIDPQAVCVCAFGALIKEPLLSEHLILNLHPSLLPRWRGAAPIERAIMAGDDHTGDSIMRLTAGLDSGPVCLQASEPIGPQDTYGTLAARLQALGGELLVRALDTTPSCVEQDESLVTYAEKLTPEDRTLDPGRSAIELERVVRSLAPHIGARVQLGDGSWLGVGQARARPDSGPPPGVLSLDRPRPVLGCAEGSLELVIVQPPGRRAMAAEDFLRGRRS
jgi:methionyl-tRNA formyltransferase